MRADKNNSIIINPLRVISLLTITAGSLALIF